MVSGPGKKDLFILVRDIDTFRTNGDREFALKFVKDQGFTLDSNKPLETFQSSKLCDYSKFDVLPNNITTLINYKLPPLFDDEICQGSQKNDPCTKENRPVCGCNNKTYPNSCIAKNDGVKHYTEGNCP